MNPRFILAPLAAAAGLSACGGGSSDDVRLDVRPGAREGATFAVSATGRAAAGEISLRLAPAGRPCTRGEDLIVPAAVDGSFRLRGDALVHRAGRYELCALRAGRTEPLARRSFTVRAPHAAVRIEEVTHDGTGSLHATVSGLAEGPAEAVLVATKDPGACDPVRPSFSEDEIEDTKVVSGSFRQRLDVFYVRQGRWTVCALLRDGEDGPLRAVARTSFLRS